MFSYGPRSKGAGLVELLSQLNGYDLFLLASFPVVWYVKVKVCN